MLDSSSGWLVEPRAKRRSLQYHVRDGSSAQCADGFLQSRPGEGSTVVQRSDLLDEHADIGVVWQSQIHAVHTRAGFEQFAFVLMRAESIV